MDVAHPSVRSLGPAKGGAKVENDLALAGRVAAGDPWAQREWVNRLLDGVRTTVYCLAGNDEDADDFVQLSILELLGSAKTFRAESSLSAWSAKITVRTTMRQLHKRRWRSQFVVFEPGLVDQALDHLSGENAEELLTKRRLQISLLRVLGTLKPKYQVALTLRLAQGYSVSEIAEITDTTLNTVRERLRVGRQKLHRMIQANPQLLEWVETKGA